LLVGVRIPDGPGTLYDDVGSKGMFSPNVREQKYKCACPLFIMINLTD
jgi:hypothetical protein